MHVPTGLAVLPVLVCVLSWFGAGLAVPAGWLPGGPLLRVLTRVGVGSVVVSLLFYALGRAGMFDRRLLVAITVGLALVALIGVRPAWREACSVRRPSRVALRFLVAVGVALVLDLIAATAPPTSADALKYHLALPRLWLQVGSIDDAFWRWESFNPSGMEVLYGQGLALGGGSAAGAVHAVFAVLCAFVVFGTGRELGGEVAGTIAAFLFIFQGLVTWEATSSFVELGLTFYCVLGVWHALRWARSPDSRGAAWTGFFAGAAAGTKYLGLLVAAILLLLWAAVAVRRRRSLDVGVAAGATLISGGAWYVKNVIVTGNPVYPLVFGGKWLTSFARQEIEASQNRYGVAHGLLRLPILPIDLALHGNAFDRGQYVGIAIFVLAALGVLLRRTPELAVLFTGVVLYLAVWSVEAPQARFLLPALAVLAAIGGPGAAQWLALTGARRLAIVIVLAVTAVAWAASSAALTRQLLPVAFGAEAHGHFLQRLTGTREALLAARARAGDGTLAVAGYTSTFLVPGRAVQIDAPAFDPSLSRRAYLDRLRQLRVTSVLAGGASEEVPQLDPIRSCLTPVATFTARFVTSRSLGHSVPYDFELFSLARCTP